MLSNMVLEGAKVVGLMFGGSVLVGIVVYAIIEATKEEYRPIKEVRLVCLKGGK